MARRKKSKKKLRKIFDKGSKARKRTRRALKDGKLTKRELLKVAKAGGSKKQLQKLRKSARGSKIKISKKVNQRKEVRQIFRKATKTRTASNQTKKTNNKNKSLLKKVKADGVVTKREIKKLASKGVKDKRIKKLTSNTKLKIRKNTNKSLLKKVKADGKVTKKEIKKLVSKGVKDKRIKKLTSNNKLKITKKAQKAVDKQTAFIKVKKAPPKSERPNLSKNFDRKKAREKVSTRFNKLAAEYKGPERMKLGIKDIGKRPKSVKQYDKLGRNEYFKSMRARIAERYLGNMGKDSTEKNMKMTQKMLKSTSPKTPNFDKVKAPYSKVLDKLRTSLGGATDYKASLKMTKDKLTKTPSVNEDKLKKKGEQYLVT